MVGFMVEGASGAGNLRGQGSRFRGAGARDGDSEDLRSGGGSHTGSRTGDREVGGLVTSASGH
jgi:hypothetical protein